MPIMTPTKVLKAPKRMAGQIFLFLRDFKKHIAAVLQQKKHQVLGKMLI